MNDRIKRVSLHARELSPLEKAHDRKEIAQVHVAAAERDTAIHLRALADLLHIEIAEEENQSLEDQRRVHQIKRHLILQQIDMIQKGEYDREHRLQPGVLITRPALTDACHKAASMHRCSATCVRAASIAPVRLLVFPPLHGPTTARTYRRIIRHLCAAVRADTLRPDLHDRCTTRWTVTCII